MGIKAVWGRTEESRSGGTGEFGARSGPPAALPAMEGFRDEHRRDMSNMPTLRCRARTFGICRRQCRQVGRVGRDRHSRSAFEGRECRPGRDLSTRCLCRRQAPDRDTGRGPAVRVALAPQPSCPDLFRASTSLRRLARARPGPRCRKTWMPGTSPGMTVGGRRRGGDGNESRSGGWGRNRAWDDSRGPAADLGRGIGNEKSASISGTYRLIYPEQAFFLDSVHVLG